MGEPLTPIRNCRGYGILMSNSAVVRKDMKSWFISEQGDKRSVKLDVRDLGDHLDTTCRAWGCTLAARGRAILRVVGLVSALPLDYRGKLRVLRTTFIPAALHGMEASLLSQSIYLRLRAAFVRACLSRRMTVAHSGTVLGMLDGLGGVDPGFCIAWFWFRMLRWYLAKRPDEVARIGRPLVLVSGGSSWSWACAC